MKRIFVICLSIAALNGAAYATQAHARYLTDNEVEVRTDGDIYVGTTSSSVHEVLSSDAASAEQASSSRGVPGYLAAQEHRSTIVEFADSLLQVADRGGPLSAQIRHIALAHREAQATTTEAMQKMAARSAMASFLFGSDYKNLDLLKGELARTQRNLAQLRTIHAQTSDAMTRAVLMTQIQALEKNQGTLVRFVLAHENSPSLFGWVTRLVH